MKIIRVVILTIAIIFLLISSIALFDYIYYPLISYKAEDVAEKYLEEKYKEDFIIVDSKYKKVLGDDKGNYQVFSHLARDPDLAVTVYVYDDMELSGDTYHEYFDDIWLEGLNSQFVLLYKELYGPPENYSYSVDVSFSDDIYGKYNTFNTYQEIFEKDHTGIGNAIEMNILLDTSSTMDDELDKVFKLIQRLKNQELNHFSLFIEYYDESLKGELSNADKALEYWDFSIEHRKSRVNVFDFSYKSKNEISKKRLENIKTPADLKQYLEKETMN